MQDESTSMFFNSVQFSSQDHVYTVSDFTINILNLIGGIN